MLSYRYYIWLINYIDIIDDIKNIIKYNYLLVQKNVYIDFLLCTPKLLISVNMHSLFFEFRTWYRYKFGTCVKMPCGRVFREEIKKLCEKQISK